jgi:hypothetical protein
MYLHVCSIIRGMVRVYMLFSTQGACCTHTYHHPLVGVATIAANYPFLTAIILWKGVTIEGSEVLLGHGMFMISTVDRLPSKGILSSVHHCCQSLSKSPG